MPVTVNYDRVLEGEAFPLDLLGEAPIRDGAFKILKQLAFSKPNLGKIIIKYGQPYSIQTFKTSYLKKNNLDSSAL
jgi:glycerol-3-phosphate O-acyltransferase